MPLTNAEKQRRYRERLKNNPEKKEEIRKKNLERIKRKTKKIQDLTEEEKAEKRKQWRKQKQNQKKVAVAAKKNETDNKHFTARDKNRNNRLNALAVPSVERQPVEPPSPHEFINVCSVPPDTFADRFSAWMDAIGGDILAMNCHDVFHKCRVCHIHFETRFHTRSKRLSPNAVPTLHLQGKNDLTQEKSPGQDHTYCVAEPENASASIGEDSNAKEVHLKPTGSKELKPAESSVKLLKPTGSKELKPTESTVNVYKPPGSKELKPTESSLKIYKPTGSKVLKPTESRVQGLESETDVQEHAIDTETTYEEEYLDTFEDTDAGGEPEEQPKGAGPFSWQNYQEEVVALDENVTVEDDVKFYGEAQAQSVPDLSDPPNQTQEEYSCNVCNERITGFRYVCVMCPDWDLCGACEAREQHSEHYVLRVPPGKPHSETAWVIATLRQMLSAREEPDLTVVKEEVKDEDPLADTDVPFESQGDDADDARETREDLDTASIEDLNTNRTSDFPSTHQKRKTTTQPDADPSKKRKHLVLKAVPIQRKDIPGNVIILGKHMADNFQNIAAARAYQKKTQIGTGAVLPMDYLKRQIPQLETRNVSILDNIRRQNISATTIPVQKEKVISVDDLKKQILQLKSSNVLDDIRTQNMTAMIPIQNKKSQIETGKVISLDDVMKQIYVVDKSKKITVRTAPVIKKISETDSEKVILRKGVISLKKPTHVVDSQKITVTAGPGMKTSHIETDKFILSNKINKNIVTLEEPNVTVSEKHQLESGEVILLDDSISNVVQPSESVVMESPAEGSNIVQVLEVSDGNMIVKVVEGPKQLNTENSHSTR